MFSSPRKKYLLFAILLLAGVFRFWGLANADVITDEAMLAFRSIGYIDFFASSYQSTPYEWFSDIPLWAKFSFHDHPPLVFVVQFFFFKIFGVNLLVLRLPFALAGVASVYLLFLIGRKLFDENVGLLAAGLLAISSAHTWVSRIGLQESLVIFFGLLAFYYFILALEDDKHYRWGVALGLALLTKYTAGIFLPIFILFGFFYNKKVFSKNFYLAVFIVVVIFSPVLVYNFNLYQERGHFDLQFSYLLNQDVPEWQFLPGKIQAGSFSDKVSSLMPNLLTTLMWPTFILFSLSFLFFIYKLLSIRKRELGLLWVTFLLIVLSWFVVGTASRFIVTIIPFVILLISWTLIQQKKTIFYFTVGIFIAIEAFVSINTLLIHYPVGPENIAYSKLKWDSYSWGYNQLNDYIDNLVRDSKPGLTFKTRYQFLENIRERQIKKDFPEKSLLLIYDVNMHDLASLWIFHRQLSYGAWPVVTAEIFLTQDLGFWKEQGVKDFYFFKIIDNDLLQKPLIEQIDAAADLSSQLGGAKIEKIKRPDGREVFAVYHFD